MVPSHHLCFRIQSPVTSSLLEVKRGGGPTEVTGTQDLSGSPSVQSRRGPKVRWGHGITDVTWTRSPNEVVTVGVTKVRSSCGVVTCSESSRSKTLVRSVGLVLETCFD